MAGGSAVFESPKERIVVDDDTMSAYTIAPTTDWIERPEGLRRICAPNGSLLPS